MNKMMLNLGDYEEFSKFLDVLFEAAEAIKAEEDKKDCKCAKEHKTHKDEEHALDLHMVKDCIIDEKNGKVVLKLITGDTYVAQVAEGDTFNAETGVLWAFAKFMFHLLGNGFTAKEFVDGCIEIAASHKERQKAKKEQPVKVEVFSLKDLFCDDKEKKATKHDVTKEKAQNDVENFLKDLINFYGGGAN